MRPTLLLASLSICASLAAQSSYIPTNTPSTGTCNVFPFGTSNMRYQALIRAAELGSLPQVITGFGLAPCATSTGRFQRVTMKMANLASPTLSTTFDQNLAAGAVTVFDAPNVVWPLQANVWNDFDLQVPFVHNGVDSLVVEFTVTGSSGATAGMHRDNTNQRVYAGNYNGQLTGTDGGLTAFKMRVITGDAQAWTFGAGCAGSNSLVPTLAFQGIARLGTAMSVDLSNGRATAPALLQVGTSSAGPVFPLDLTPYGAPGCLVYHDYLVALGAVTGSSGAASVPLNIPNAATLVGTKLYFQFVNLDPGANTIGITTSNYGRAVVGN